MNPSSYSDCFGRELLFHQGQDLSSGAFQFVRLLRRHGGIVSSPSVGTDDMEHRKSLLDLPCLFNCLGLLFGDLKLPVERSNSRQGIIHPGLGRDGESVLGMFGFIDDLPQDMREFLQSFPRYVFAPGRHGSLRYQTIRTDQALEIRLNGEGQDPGTGGRSPGSI